MEVIASGGNTTIKSDGQKFYLYVNGTEVESSPEYKNVAKLATDIYVSKLATKDENIGKRLFVPSAIGADSPVIVVGRTSRGYLVQRVGSDQRFEITAECLSEVPVSYFK